MKTPRYSLFRLLACCVAGGLALLAASPTLSAKDAPSKAATPSVDDAKTASAGTNAVTLEVPIPASLFEVTNIGVKDPFFPLSLRQAVTVSTNAATALSSSSFQLKVVAGLTKSKLVTINNRTMAAGEDAEVTVATGKVKIHCVEIREASAIIRVSNQDDLIELRFRKGF